MQVPTTIPLLPFGAPDQGYATARVTSPYGWRDNPLYPDYSTRAQLWHDGLDIGNARSGDEVVAVAAGIVIAEGWLREPWSQAAPIGAKWAGGNYGGVMAVVDHGAGIVSVYAHLADTVVNASARVATGQLLGHIGDTGSAKAGGAHLHLTVLINGAAVDPWPLITAPPAETREDRLAHHVIAYRAALPLFTAALLRNTTRPGKPGLTQELDGVPMDRELRLSIEITMDRLAAALGDETAAILAARGEA